MTSHPVSQLPPIDMEHLRPLQRWARLILDLAVILTTVLVHVVRHHGNALQVWEATAAGIFLLLRVIALPAFQAMRIHHQRVLQKALAPTTVYEGSARLRQGRTRFEAQKGTVAVSTTGIRFAPAGDFSPWLTLPWDQVLRLEVRTGASGSGRLIVHLVDGGGQEFMIPTCRVLIETLTAWRDSGRVVTRVEDPNFAAPPWRPPRSLKLGGLLSFAVVAFLAVRTFVFGGPTFSYRIVTNQIRLTSAGSLIVPFVVTNSGHATGRPWCVVFSLTSLNDPVSNSNFTEMSATLSPGETKTLELSAPTQLTENGANPGNPKFVQVTCDPTSSALNNDTSDVTATLPSSVTNGYAKFPSVSGNT